LKKIVFRVDASLKIGTGHIMRCLSLARNLHKDGESCRFVCRAHPGHQMDRISNEGFKVIALPAPNSTFEAKECNGPALVHESWIGSSWHHDAQETIEALAGDIVDWLVVDHYGLDHRWEHQLRSHAKRIMAIDDLADRKHDCDLLLDQNLVANLERRYDGLVPSHCVKLLGPKYALLQPEYSDLHARTPPRLGPVRCILVSFGGADLQNVNSMVIKAFLALKRDDVQLDVVTNMGTSHFEALRIQAKAHPKIQIHRAQPSLAPLMLQADLAIGASGATSWERCCLGLPALVITSAENQQPIAEKLHAQGLVRCLGNIHAVKAEDVIQALHEILEGNDLEQWSRRCLKPVDGKGAERVVEIQNLNPATPLKARLAQLKDEALLLGWANDPLVRRSSFQSGTIDNKTHRRWFYNRLREVARCKIYILETDRGLPIGQVRFEKKAGGWEVDFSLAQEARGVGLGRPLVKAAIDELLPTESGTMVYGRVKPDNLGSQKVFEHLGFSAKLSGAEIIYSRLL